MKRILTGDRPTGKLHLGHYVGTLSNRVALQGKYEIFIPIVDLHSLTDRMDNPEKIKQTPDHIHNMVLDYLAVGINPDKSTIFIQSAIPETAELFTLFMNLVTIARCERIPTLKEKIRDQHIEYPSMGLLNYPILMAADILSVKAELVPVGKDQESHVEFAREIAKSFNRLFGKNNPIFPIPEAIIGEAQTLPGTDGKAKMSKSLNNAIYLSDDEETITKKIMGMYTDPNRIHADTPGTVEGNPVFAYLDAFNKDIASVDKLKDQYRKGQVPDVELKKVLAQTLISFLKPIQFRRQNFESQKGLVNKILSEGNKKAREEVVKTLEEVKKALSL
jgi:tryptophanyl-tRNA synthetase